MKMINAILICSFVILLMLAMQTVVSAESVGFTAELTIDNVLEFEWSEKGSGYVSIYGTDSPLGGEETIIAENIPAKNGKLSYDLEAEGKSRHNKYYILSAGGKKTLCELKTVLPRRTTEITTLSHPFLVTNQEGIDKLKETIKTNKVFKSNFDEMIKRADSNCTILAGYSDARKGNATREEANKTCFMLSNVAMAYVLTDDVKYLEAGRKGFDLLVNYLYDNQSIIFEMKSDFPYVEEVAIAYDLFYNSLTDTERQIYENGILRVWMERLFACLRGRSSNQGGTNHVAVILGCLLKDREYLDKGLFLEGYGFWFNWLNAVNDDGSMWNQPTRYYAQLMMYLYRMTEVLYNSGFDIYEMEISGDRTSEYLDDTTNWRDAKDGDYTSVTNLNVHKIMAEYMYNFQFFNRHLDIGDTQAHMKYSLTSDEFLKTCEVLWKRYHDERAAWILSQHFGKGDREKGFFVDFAQMFYAEPHLGEPEFKIGTGYFAKMGYNRLGSTVFEDYGQAILRGRDVSEVSTGLYWQRYVESHMHNDMFNFTLFAKGDHIIFDPGTYDYGTEGQRGYARSSLAHNSLIIDETARWPGFGEPGGGEWANDILVDGKMTRGFLENAAIGTAAKAVKVWSDRAYSPERNGINSTLGRTLWQLDNYAIDVYTATSDNAVHTYDYTLNINGTLSESSRKLNPSKDPNEALKDGNTAYKYIKNLYRSGAGNETWYNVYDVLSGAAKLKITMLGDDNTEVIKGKAPDRAMVYNQEKLIVRRKSNKAPAFITLYEVENDMSAMRNISEEKVYCDGKAVEWAKGVSVTTGNIADRFIYGDSYGVKQSGDLYSDAETAYLRQIDGEDKAIGLMGGKFVSGKKVALSFRRNSSAQLALLEDGSWRLDMAKGEQEDTVVTVLGLDRFKVYEMDFETGELTYVTNLNTFDVKAEGIYILSDKEELNVSSGVVLMAADADKFAAFGKVLELRDELEIPQNAIIVEGEDITEQTGGEIKYGTYEGDYHTTNNENGTAFYMWDNSGHTLKWKFNLEEAGKYNVIIRYSSNSGEDSLRIMKFNEGDKYVLSFANTGTWNKPRTNVKICDENYKPYTFELNAGENVIEMVNINTALNFDCIALVPVN